VTTQLQLINIIIIIIIIINTSNYACCRSTSLRLTRGTHGIQPGAKCKCTGGSDEPETGHGLSARYS